MILATFKSVNNVQVAGACGNSNPSPRIWAGPGCIQTSALDLLDLDLPGPARILVLDCLYPHRDLVDLPARRQCSHAAWLERVGYTLGVLLRFYAPHNPS